MKYIKNFENKSEIEKEYYVVVKPILYLGILEYSIGKIKEKFLSNSGLLSYIVNFDEKYEWWIEREDIIDWSKNKEDLEQYSRSNKYNI